MYYLILALILIPFVVVLVGMALVSLVHPETLRKAGILDAGEQPRRIT